MLLVALGADSWDEAIRAHSFVQDLPEDIAVASLAAGFPHCYWQYAERVAAFEWTLDDSDRNRQVWDVARRELGKCPLLIVDPLKAMGLTKTVIPPDWLAEWPGPILAADWHALLNDDLSPALPAPESIRLWPGPPCKLLKTSPPHGTQTPHAWRSLDILSRLQASTRKDEILASLGEPGRHLVVAAFHPATVAGAKLNGQGLHFVWVVEALRAYLDAVCPTALLVTGLDQWAEMSHTHFLPLPRPGQYEQLMQSADLIVADSPFSAALPMAAAGGIPAVVAGASGQWDGRLLTPYEKLWPPVADRLIEVARQQPQAVFPHPYFPHPSPFTIGTREAPAPYYQADLLNAPDMFDLLNHFLLHEPSRVSWRDLADRHVALGRHAAPAHAVLEALS